MFTKSLIERKHVSIANIAPAVGSRRWGARLAPFQVEVPYMSRTDPLTYWGRVTHICVSNLTIIGSDNGLSPGPRQAIIWNNAGILLIGPLGTNFNEISIEIHTFSFKKMHFKMSSAKWRPFCLGLNVLRVNRRGPGPGLVGKKPQPLHWNFPCGQNWWAHNTNFLQRRRWQRLARKLNSKEIFTKAFPIFK